MLACGVKYRTWLFAFAICGLSACNAYDASLVRVARDNQVAAGAGAGAIPPSTGGAWDGGSGTAGQAAAEDDAGVVVGPDAPARCGDGRVDRGEKCDTGIASGTTGAC